MSERLSSNSSSNGVSKYSQLSRNTRTPSNGKGKSSTSTMIIVIGLIAVSVIGFIWLINTNKSSEDNKAEVSEEQSSGNETSEKTHESEEEAEAEPEAEDIDVSDKSDDTEASEAPLDENYSTDDQTIGDEAITGAKISGFDQEAYEGFLRIIFTIESESGIPHTTANLVTDANMINMKINGLDSDESGITRGTGFDVTGSVVSTIFHEVTGEEHLGWYKIGIKESTNFYLHTLDEEKIILDIQEKEIENGNGEEFEFSTESQGIEGDADGNVITVSGLSHSDQPSEGVFRVIFRLGSIGTGSIPSASAELVDYEGGKAIKLEISDMYSDFAAEDDYTEDYGNKAVAGMVGSFSENVSTYYIKITSESEYKLYYRSAPAQLIVDVKL